MEPEAQTEPDFSKITLADFPASQRDDLYRILLMGRLVPGQKVFEVADLYEDLGGEAYEETVKSGLVELMPLSSRLIDLWDWDVHFENEAFEDRDTMFEAAIADDDESLEMYAKYLYDSWVYAIDRFGIEMCPEEFEDDTFDEYLEEECRKFMRDWRANVLRFATEGVNPNYSPKSK